jgi:hypothetical protein
MKNFAINTVSNLMSAVALVGAVAMFAPAEAKADSGDVVAGLIFGAILADVLDNDRGYDRNIGGRIVDREVGMRVGGYNRHNDVNPFNERHKPGYARGRRTGEVCGTTTNYRRHTVDIIYTDCYGNVVDIVTRRR